MLWRNGQPRFAELVRQRVLVSLFEESWPQCIGDGKGATNDLLGHWRALPARRFGRTGTGMHRDIASKKAELAALVRRYGVTRLEVFGSAAPGDDFDQSRSDADFLVTFTQASRDDLAAFVDLKEALERLLGRPVDLVEREAVEASRNFIRRRRILAEAEEPDLQQFVLLELGFVVVRVAVDRGDSVQYIA